MKASLSKIFFGVGLCLLLWLATLAGSSSAEVTALNEENFEELVGEGEWLVELYAPWCSMCKRFEGEFQALATRLETEKNAPKVRLGKVNVDECMSLSARFFVSGIPTLYHIKNQEVRQYTGPRTVSDLYKMLKDESWQGIEKWQYLSPFSVPGKILGFLATIAVVVLKEVKNIQAATGVPMIALGTFFFIISLVVAVSMGFILDFVLSLLTGRSRPSKPQRTISAGVDKKNEGDSDPPAKDTAPIATASPTGSASSPRRAKNRNTKKTN